MIIIEQSQKNKSKPHIHNYLIYFLWGVKKSKNK